MTDSVESDYYAFMHFDADSALKKEISAMPRLEPF